MNLLLFLETRCLLHLISVDVRILDCCTWAVGICDLVVRDCAVTLRLGQSHL